MKNTLIQHVLIKVQFIFVMYNLIFKKERKKGVKVERNEEFIFVKRTNLKR